MRTKIILNIVLIYTFCAGIIVAQGLEPSTVFISTSSVTQIPADNIYFAVTLSVQNEDATKAYEEHKSLEKKLLNVCREFEIADSNISYSLLNIGNAHSQSKGQPLYRTRQIVSVKFDDFSKYEPLQLALLSKGIYNFKAKFTSGNADEWIDKGIQEAILKATKEAEMIAKNSRKKLGNIMEIESSHYYPSASDGITAITVQQPGESLIDLPHFVQMRVSLRVKFELLENE
jgi:uncharacterized protein YggE